MKSLFKIENLLLSVLWVLLICILCIYLFFYEELVYQKNTSQYLWTGIIILSIGLYWLKYKRAEKINLKQHLLWVVVVAVFTFICLAFIRPAFQEKAKKIVNSHSER